MGTPIPFKESHLFSCTTTVKLDWTSRTNLSANRNAHSVNNLCYLGAGKHASISRYTRTKWNALDFADKRVRKPNDKIPYTLRPSLTLRAVHPSSYRNTAGQRHTSGLRGQTCPQTGRRNTDRSFFKSHPEIYFTFLEHLSEISTRKPWIAYGRRGQTCPQTERAQ